MFASLVRVLGLLGTALLLASCSGPFFSKVQIKASPTVYAALGTAKAEISDHLTVAKIRDLFKSSPEVKVYDYQDASTIQKFLVHYPLTSVELEFSEYLKELDLDSSLSQTLTPGTFEIPSLNQTVSADGTFDLNATLRTQVNGGFGTPSTTFIETGSGTTITPPAGTLPDVTVSVSQFDTATFLSGSLDLAFSMPTASGSLILNAQVSILSGGTVLTSTPGPVNIKGGTATLDLTGVTLPSSFQVRFNATTSGGTAGAQPVINVTPSLSGTAAISAATGLDLPATSVSVGPISVPVNSSGKLVSATVGTGTIEIELAPLWSGFTRSTDLVLDQNGTILAQVDDSTSDTITIDLAGKALTNFPISVSATSSISATNGSLSGLGTGSVTLGADAVVDIGLFTTIRVEPGTDFQAEQSISEPITQQMKDWVDSINFTRVGVQFEITNGLPTDNDMTIDLESTVFGLNYGTPKALPSGQSAGQSTTAVFDNRTAFVFNPSAPPSTIDFRVKLQPDSYDGTAMDLNNIVPGTLLSIGGTVTLIAEWTTAQVSPPTGGYAGTFPGDGSDIDLSPLADYLGSGLSLGSIPTFLSLSGIPSTKMDTVLSAHHGGTPPGRRSASSTVLASMPSSWQIQGQPSMPMETGLSPFGTRPRPRLLSISKPSSTPSRLI